MDDRSPFDPEDLPEGLLHLVKPELQPGERLLWASRGGARSPSVAPAPSWGARIWFRGFLAVSAGSLIAIPFLSTSRPLEGLGAFLAIVGVVSGIITFLFITGFLGNYSTRRAERRKLQGQSYALTDRRALIWTPLANTAMTVLTFQRGTIKGEELHRVQFPDGSGDVLFRSNTYGPTVAGFLGIEEVRRVEELTRRFLVVPNATPEPEPDFEDDAYFH